MNSKYVYGSNLPLKYTVMLPYLQSYLRNTRKFSTISKFQLQFLMLKWSNMLIFETVLIQSFGWFWPCLFSKHAYFQKVPYYRASTVLTGLDNFIKFLLHMKAALFWFIFRPLSRGCHRNFRKNMSSDEDSETEVDLNNLPREIFLKILVLGIVIKASKELNFPLLYNFCFEWLMIINSLQWLNRLSGRQ